MRLALGLLLVFVTNFFFQLESKAGPRPPNAPPVLLVQTSYPDAENHSTVRFTTTGTNDPDGTIASISFTFGDGTSGTGSTFDHVYANNGTYIVNVVATDNLGLSTRLERRVVVVANPEPLSPQGFIATPTVYNGSGRETSFTLNYSVAGNSPSQLYKIKVLNADGVTTNQSLRVDGLILTLNGQRITETNAMTKSVNGWETYVLMNPAASNQLIMAISAIAPSYVTLSVEKYGVTDDGLAPRLAFGVIDGQKTNQKTQTITVTDTSATKTTVTLNGTEIFSQVASKTLTFDLAEGSNAFSVSSKDAAWNIGSGARAGVVLDTVLPTFAATLPGDIYVTALPHTLNFSVHTSENATVTANSSSMSGGPQDFTSSINITTAGLLSTTIKATDEAGNAKTEVVETTVHVDALKPTIELGSFNVGPASVSTFYVPVTVTDDSPVLVDVKVDGQVMFSTGAKIFTAPVLVDTDGIHTVSFVATDAAGNTSDVSQIQVVRDTTPPSILAVTPTTGSQLDRMIFAIAAACDEPLQAAKIGSQAAILATDKLSFSLNYVSQSQGSIAVEIEVKDLAGNIATTTVNYSIVPRLLNAELVFVTPSANGSKLLVVGQAGATRPGVSLEASDGFFGLNSVSGESGPDGSFGLALDYFSSATLSVSDSSTNESTTMNVTYARDTSLSGVVRDDQDAPIAGVTVSIESTGYTATTDPNGVFVIDSPITGDQTLVVDGHSALAPTGSGPSRTFSKTKILINIGLGQNNALSRPIYLIPQYFDGEQTEVAASQSAIVTSDHAPGVAIELPAGVTTFPDGSSFGSITISTISSDRATIATPASAIPEKVLAMEPSGTHFSTPVELTLPNAYELPPGTDMVILSMNSDKGLWEVDGFAKVTQDGNSIQTKPGMGITHFSLVYAVPIMPVIKEVSEPSLSGVDASKGSYSTTVRLPTYKAYGSDFGPALIYKSAWASPKAVITNFFDIPKSEYSVTVNQSGIVAAGRWLDFKRCFFGLVICGVEAYLQTIEQNVTGSVDTAYVPESIRAQFFVGTVASNQINYVTSDPGTNDLPGPIFDNRAPSEIVKMAGIPNRSLISYGLPLKNGENQFLPTGVYPTLARYEVKLKGITITTTTSKYTTRVNGEITNVDVKAPESLTETRLLQQALPQDVRSQILVQNKVQSPFGRGWHLSGPQKIVNPENDQLMIEEENGELATYSIDNSISTAFTQPSIPIDFDAFFNFENWPTIGYAYRNPNSLVEYWYGETNANSPSDPGRKAIVKQNGGWFANQGYQECPINGANFQSAIYSFGNKSIFTGFAEKDGLTYVLSQKEHGLFRSYFNTSFRAYVSEPVVGGRSRFIDYAGNYSNFSNRASFNGAIIPTSFAFRVSDTATAKNICNSLFGQECGAPESVTTHACSEVCIQNGTYTSPWCFGAQNKPGNIIYSNGQVATPGAISWNGQERFDLDWDLTASCTSGFGATCTKFKDVFGLNNPSALLRESDGTFLISDSGNNRVYKVNFSDRTIHLIAGNGANNDTGLEGIATQMPIFHPKSMLKDSFGNLYISSERGFIRKITPSGQILTIAGKPAELGGILTDQTAAKNMAFAEPMGMAIDEDKNWLYVADTKNHRVVRIDLISGIASRVAGIGSCDMVNTGDGGVALNASLCNPTYLSLDSSKNLLIVDSGHKRIRRVVFNQVTGSLALYKPLSKDLSQLQRNPDGTWVRSYRNGSQALFDISGRQTRFTSTSGQQVNYGYDSQGRIITITDSAGQTTNYEYTGGLLSRITDPSSRSTTFSYSNSRLTSVNFPDGTSRQFQYNSNDVLVKEVDQRGGERTVAYNEYGRVMTVTEPNGGVTSVSDSGSQTAMNSYTGTSSGPLRNSGIGENQIGDDIVDARGAETIMSNDYNGYVTRIKSADGAITTIERDKDGRPTAVIYPNQSRKTFTYDPATGDLLTTLDSETGRATSTTYNSRGQVLTQTDQDGRTTTHTYSSSGQEIQTKLPDNTIIDRTFNVLGLVATETLHDTAAGDLTTAYTYDVNGNLATITDPEGRIATFTRDTAGNVISEVKRKDASVTISKSIAYDQWNRILSISEPGPNTSFYEYDVAGNLIKMKDSAGKETNYEYNSLNLMTRTTDPAGRILTRNYDLNGNITTETQPNGNVKQFVYNSMNRMTQKVLPEGTTTYQYDTNGNLNRVSNSSSTVEFTSTREGRITSERTYGAGLPDVTLSYTYNAIGNRNAIDDSLGGRIAYSYNSMNRLTSLTNSNGQTYAFNFDRAGRLVTQTRPGSNSEYVTDKLGTVTNISHKVAGSVLSSFTYSYDKLGNRLEEATPIGISSYIYDLRSQVTNVTYTSSSFSTLPTETFAYDSIGNRISDRNGTLSYSSNGQRLVSNYKYDYTYDQNGNLISRVKRANGESTVFTYSSENQLIEIRKFPSASANAYTQRVTFGYDPLGRRNLKTVETPNESGPTNNYQRRFVRDGDDVVMEFNESTDLIARYTHSRNRPDDILGMEVTSAGVSAGISTVAGSFQFIKDSLGSVRKVTTSAGAEVQSYEYSAYGDLVAVLNSSGATVGFYGAPLKQPYMFAAREYEPENELYFNRARYYDPSNGRFLQPDPSPGAIDNPMSATNRYIYGLNSPAKFTDPSGNFIFLIGFAVSLAAESWLAGTITAWGAAALTGALSGLALLEARHNFDDSKMFREERPENILGVVLISALGGAFGKWAGDILGAKTAGWINNTFNIVNKNLVRETTKTAFSGAIASGTATGGLIAAGYVKGDVSDVGKAIAFGGAAGLLTGGAGYYLHTPIAVPVVIVNETGWFLSTGSE